MTTIHTTSQTHRTTVLAAEDKIGNIIPCLDKGYVQIIDYMGSDLDIVQAARISYGPSAKAITEDRGLLRYMYRHGHTSPFEMCEIKFRCKMPIFVARQWIRHRTANVNEMSLRYTEAPDEFYVPTLECVQLQSRDNKQGRDTMTELSDGQREQVVRMLTAHDEQSYALYHELAVDLGIAKELSRTALGVSLYTQWIWKCDLHNLLHFLSLRLDSHAQYEIRVFAEAMADFVKAWVPIAWEAFEDYKLHARRFSRMDRQVLAAVLNDYLGTHPETGLKVKESADMKSAIEWYGKLAGLVGRELEELVSKFVS